MQVTNALASEDHCDKNGEHALTISNGEACCVCTLADGHVKQRHYNIVMDKKCDNQQNDDLEQYASSAIAVRVAHRARDGERTAPLRIGLNRQETTTIRQYSTR